MRISGLHVFVFVFASNYCKNPVFMSIKLSRLSNYFNILKLLFLPKKKKIDTNFIRWLTLTGVGGRGGWVGGGVLRTNEWGTEWKYFQNVEFL